MTERARMASEFRKDWGQFDLLGDEIDPHLYEVNPRRAWRRVGMPFT
jgi:hypothetical protein